MSSLPTEDVPLAFLDCETTKLGPGARAWEIGLIRRPAGATRTDDRKHHWFIYTHDLDLGNADPTSLTIGRFYERHPQALYNKHAAGARPENQVMEEIEKLTRGARILGSKPSFDQEILDARMRAHGLIPAWHHHPEDVPAMARGWKIGMGTPRNEAPRRSDDISRACGINPDDYDRHTALGDCAWMRDLYDRVTTPPGFTAQLQRVTITRVSDEPATPPSEATAAEPVSGGVP